MAIAWQKCGDSVAAPDRRRRSRVILYLMTDNASVRFPSEVVAHYNEGVGCIGSNHETTEPTLVRLCNMLLPTT